MGNVGENEKAGDDEAKVGAGCALASVESDEQKEMENVERNSKQAAKDGDDSDGSDDSNDDSGDDSGDDSNDDSGNNDQSNETRKKEKRELVVKVMKLESESRLLAETPGMEVLVGDDDTQFGSEDDCDQEDYQLVVNEFLKVMSTGDAGPPGYWYDVVWDFDLMTLQETLRLVGMGASPLEAVTEALLCTPQHMRPVEYQDPERDMIVKAIEMVQAKSEAANATARTMVNHETESQEEQLRGEVQTGVKCKTNEAAESDNAQVWMVWATWPPNCWPGGRSCVLQHNELHRGTEHAALGEKHVANLLRDQVGVG